MFTPTAPVITGYFNEMPVFETHPQLPVARTQSELRRTANLCREIGIPNFVRAITVTETTTKLTPSYEAAASIAQRELIRFTDTTGVQTVNVQYGFVEASTLLRQHTLARSTPWGLPKDLVPAAIVDVAMGIDTLDTLPAGTSSVDLSGYKKAVKKQANSTGMLVVYMRDIARSYQILVTGVPSTSAGEAALLRPEQCTMVDPDLKLAIFEK